MKMKINLRADDRRLCTGSALGLHNSSQTTAVLVMLMLYTGPVGSEPTSLHALTPAEARDKALALWSLAEEADKQMNAAVSGKGNE